MTGRDGEIWRISRYSVSWLIVGAVPRAAGTQTIFNFAAILAAFSNRDFAIYVSGNSISLIGNWTQRVAIGWLAWTLTGSNAWIGVIAFADLFPVFLVGPIAGLLADRVHLPRMILACQALQLLMSILLFALTALGLITIEILVALTSLHGVIVGFHQPARLALAPDLVRQTDLASALAINSVVFNLARFIGPAVAGVIITGWGIAPAFAFNAVTFAAMLVAVSCLRVPRREASSGPSRGVLSSIMDGARYGFSHLAIGPLLYLSMARAILVFPLIELLPGFADGVFERGAAGLAILTSTVGIGAVVGGLWLAQRGSVKGLTTITLAAAGASCLAVVLFTSTDNFMIAVPTMAVTGFVMVVSGISTQILIQSAVDVTMRGRVMSLWGMIARGGVAVGALGMGWLITFFGSAWPVAAGALLCGAVVIATSTRRRPMVALIEQGKAPHVGQQR